MMARRIPSILPDLNFEEALEITKIHSIAGELPPKIPIITITASNSGIVKPLSFFISHFLSYLKFTTT